MASLSTAEGMEWALSQAVAGPADLPEPDAGAVLALACHCVMVDAGFSCTLPSGDSPANKWAPPPRWAAEFKDEWVFRYSLAGKRHPLVLHCSLQRASGRMLAHTIEVRNERNSHLLGLLLERYVPDESKLRSPSWSGVFANAAALTPMVHQHLIAPLLEGAEDVPPAGEEEEQLQQQQRAGAGGAWALWGWLADPLRGGAGPGGAYVVPAVAATAVALAAVGVGVYLARRRRR